MNRLKVLCEVDLDTVPSYTRAIASCFDLTGTLSRIRCVSEKDAKIQIDFYENDAEAMWADWNSVAQDFWSAYDATKARLNHE